MAHDTDVNVELPENALPTTNASTGTTASKVFHPYHFWKNGILCSAAGPQIDGPGEGGTGMRGARFSVGTAAVWLGCTISIGCGEPSFGTVGTVGEGAGPSCVTGGEATGSAVANVGGNGATGAATSAEPPVDDRDGFV